jgi:flagellar hook assembly protein FlgD
MLPLFVKKNPPPPPPPSIPKSFAVAQNYPNPFNSSTVIETDVPKTGKMTLEIINILGQRVRTLYNGDIKAGYHRFIWDGTDQRRRAVATGVYFYRTILGSSETTKKMVLLK